MLTYVVLFYAFCIHLINYYIDSGFCANMDAFVSLKRFRALLYISFRFIMVYLLCHFIAFFNTISTLLQCIKDISIPAIYNTS